MDLPFYVLVGPYQFAGVPVGCGRGSPLILLVVGRE